MKIQRIHYSKKGIRYPGSRRRASRTKRYRTRCFRRRPRCFPRNAKHNARIPGYYFLSVLLILALVLAIRLFVPALLSRFLHGDEPLSFPSGIQTSFALSSDTNDFTPSPEMDGFADKNADTLLALACSRLGDPCFEQTARPDDYLDCSALVQWCFAQMGTALPRTAAEQAEYCQIHGLTVSASQLRAGDLIFWSFEENGRFQNISHTGIYAGNGRVIDASLSRKQVVLRPLYGAEQIVMCGRIPF